MLKQVGDNDFIQEVENNNGVVVVDFWATWCGPCKMLTPVIEDLANELSGKVEFVKVNVDENPGVTSKYKILSIPTVIVFDKGKVVETLVGFRPKQELLAVVEKYI